MGSWIRKEMKSNREGQTEGSFDDYSSDVRKGNMHRWKGMDIYEGTVTTEGKEGRSAMSSNELREGDRGGVSDKEKLLSYIYKEKWMRKVRERRYTEIK